MKSQNKRLVGEFCTTLIMNEIVDDMNWGVIPRGSMIHALCEEYHVFQEGEHVTQFEQWYKTKYRLLE